MSELFYSIITNQGIDLINTALADNTKLDLAFIAVGDSNGEYYEPQCSQTQLVNEKYRMNVTEVSNLTAQGMIPADIGGFYIREVGLFDKFNRLILVAKQPETYKPLELEGSTKEMWIKVIIRAINSDVLELKVDKSMQYATVEWVLSLFEEYKKSTTMQITTYDTNFNGLVDTCEIIDGGDFLHSDDVTGEISDVVMSAIIYDQNRNGIIDTCEYVDGEGFLTQDGTVSDPRLEVFMQTDRYDTDKNSAVDRADSIDAGEF
ncbi:phage tail protein [bacterium]|nr:phage tail protein [bacterium]